MKDLDFDELDRAVSSLMGDKNASAPAVSSSVPPTPVTSPPADEAVLSETVTTPPVTVSRPTPPAARRGGRFMDMVPAARKPKEATPAPVSREGTSIQPVNPITIPPAAEEPLDTLPKTPTIPVAGNPPSSTTTTDWPDPLELATSKAASAPEEASPSLPDSLTTSFGDDGGSKAEPTSEEPTPSVKDPAPIDEPLSSPFLPDTKVEKRPLGGAALASTGDELMVEDENAQLPALPKDVEPALPEELHGDVVSIAADNSTTDPTRHAESAPESQTIVKKDTPKFEPKKPVVTVAEAAVPSGPASIPQQYKEEPNSGDQKNGAIYDTDSYHEPLSHPEKKKSGWGWVLWILVILLVGAGSGAALYFLGIF